MNRKLPTEAELSRMVARARREAKERDRLYLAKLELEELHQVYQPADAAQVFKRVVAQALAADDKYIERLPISLAKAIAALLVDTPTRGRPRFSGKRRIREAAIYGAHRQKLKYLTSKERKEKRLSKEDALIKVLSEIESDAFLSREAPSRVVKADPGRPIYPRPIEAPKPREWPKISLEKALGKEKKNYSAATIKDRLQRRKPRTGK